MKIIVTKVHAQDLEPGDLFSNAGEEYWNDRDPMAVGEKVYIRTECPCPPHDFDRIVYRIEIET